MRCCNCKGTRVVMAEILRSGAPERVGLWHAIGTIRGTTRRTKRRFLRPREERSLVRRSIASGTGDADRARSGGGGSFTEWNPRFRTKTPLVRAAHELTQEEDEFIVFATAGEPHCERPRSRDPLQSHPAAPPRHPAELRPAPERRPGGTDPP